MDTFSQFGIPVILTMAGLAFLFAAIFGSIGSFASLPQSRQPLAGGVGIILLMCGIGTYLLNLPVVNIVVTAPASELASGQMNIGVSGDVFSVDARREWQITDMAVEEGAQIHFEVVDGQWTSWEGTAMYTMGEGTGYVCANVMPATQCVEYLPEAPAGALIGRIGDHVFYIGQGTTMIAQVSGVLALAINDAPGGLHDNAGELLVRIAIEPDEPR